MDNCLEDTGGGWALVRDAADMRDLVPEDLALAACRFDQLALRLVRRSAERTGEAISVLVNALNPSVVVTGGAISSANDAFTVPFAKTIRGAAVPLALATCRSCTRRVTEMSRLTAGTLLSSSNSSSGHSAKGSRTGAQPRCCTDSWQRITPSRLARAIA